MSFFDELKRRNVFKVAVAYAVAAWLLLQIVDLVLENINAPDWVMQVFMLGLAVGFPIAIIIAWAFEVTPDGVKLEKNVDRSQSVTRTTGQQLNRGIIVILSVAVVFLLTDRYRNPDRPEASTGPQATMEAEAVISSEPIEPAVETTEKSIAVLPFVNMSSDPEQEYFSDGVSEEILNVLTRIPNLKVAARTSSFQFKGQNLDVADIGRQLQVNHLLEGSVRKAGNTLRITAQLVETETGFHLWSETFDRKLEDVFAIQDEIAAAIAMQLKTLLSDEIGTSSKTVDMRAYELYLKGRGLVARRGQAELFEGIDILTAALEIEPGHAPTMATLAKAYVVLPFFSSKLLASEAREQARNWAEKALQIDAENVEALAVLGIVYNELDINPKGAIELLQRAIELNPGSVVANNFLGDVYIRVGDLDNALKYETRAAELDPLGPVQLTDLVSIHLIKGEYESAVRLSNRALALDPAFSHAFLNLGFAHYFLGDAEQLSLTIQRYSKLAGSDADRIEQLKICLQILDGKKQEAKTAFRERLQLANTGQLPAVFVIASAIQLGEFDSAGFLLQKALSDKDGRWIYPLWTRLPEQAPDSEPWQEFWQLPQVQSQIELRRKNGLNPHAPTPPSGAKS
jgi:TolB-like protein/Tfp pilus assembly protein PilF